MQRADDPAACGLLEHRAQPLVRALERAAVEHHVLVRVALQQRALRKGFLYVASGPLVRSSYKAAEFYIEGMLRRQRAEGATTR